MPFLTVHIKLVLSCLVTHYDENKNCRMQYMHKYIIIITGFGSRLIWNIHQTTVQIIGNVLDVHMSLLKLQMLKDGYSVHFPCDVLVCFLKSSYNYNIAYYTT